MEACVVCLDSNSSTRPRYMLPCKCCYPLCDACLPQVHYCLYCRRVMPAQELKRLSEFTHEYLIHQRRLLRGALDRVDLLQAEVRTLRKRLVVSFALGFVCHHFALVWFMSKYYSQPAV